jgi:hypothetical protein
MNVTSEPIGHNLRHLTKYVLVYPQGVVPPWLPEDYQPEECIEDYELAFSGQPSVVGQTWKAENQEWRVTQVQTYRPMESSGASTECFLVAVCTKDGSIPDRTLWHTGTPPLLVIHALANES